MESTKPYKIALSFPGNLEYVSPVRKFISEILIRRSFSEKFAYRSEVIVDEICTNAICYGCKSSNAIIHFTCFIHEDRIEFEIKDEGGKSEDLNRLKVAVDDPKERQKSTLSPFKEMEKECLGLEIVKMLSEKIDLDIDENNVTTIRIERKCKAVDNL